MCGIKTRRRNDPAELYMFKHGQSFVAGRGAPSFVDIRPDTMNIDETKIEAAISGADESDLQWCIMPALACEMDTIMDIAAPLQPDGGRECRAGGHEYIQGKALGTNWRFRLALGGFYIIFFIN
jgi:dTDP-4-amino-4,6-dideoxygalactose transaminase